MKAKLSSLQDKILQRIQQWENNPDRMKSGYDYEKTFVEMWQGLGQDVIQSSMGDLPLSRNGKKNFKPVSEK